MKTSSEPLDEPVLRTGIDVRSDLTICALSDGETARPVPSRSVEHTPTRLEIDPTGSSATGVFVGDDVTGEHGSIIRALTLSTFTDDGESGIDTELPVTAFLRELRSQWETSLPEVAAQLGVEIDEPESEEPLIKTAFTSPGAYTNEEQSRVANAARAAGYDPVDVLPSPVAVAVAESSTVEESRRLLALDVGPDWFDGAIVDVDPDTHTFMIRARVSEHGVGRRALDNAVAEWALERTAENLGTEITYDDDALEAVRKRASEVVTIVSHQKRSGDDEPSADLLVPDVTGVETNVGLDAVTVDVTVDSHVLSRAFEGVVSDMTTLVTDLVERTPDDDSIDNAVVAGSAAVTDAVERAVEGVLGDRPDPGRFDPIETPAIGAALFATWEHLDGVEVVDETTDRGYGIETAAESGVVYTELVEPGEGSTTGVVRLVTTVDHQQNARFTVVSRSPVTEELTDEYYVELGEIPPHEAGETEIEVTIEYADGRIDVSSELVGSDTDAEPLVAVETEPLDNANIPPIRLSEAGNRDVDTSRVLGPAGNLTRRRTPVADAFEEQSVQAVLDNVYTVRHDLRKLVDWDSDVSIDNIESMLRQFDNGLQFLGIEPIEPEPGDEIDGRYHREIGMQPAAVPAGRVAEVARSGYCIDEYVAEPASIVVSEGPEELEEEPEEETTESADDTDEAATVEEPPESETQSPSAATSEPSDDVDGGAAEAAAGDETKESVTESTTQDERDSAEPTQPDESPAEEPSADEESADEPDEEVLEVSYPNEDETDSQ